MSRAGAVFIDRDGVLNDLVSDPVSGHRESPLAPADVTLMPDAAGALRRLRDAGWRLVGVSNQPAAAKGRISLQQLHAVQARVIELLATEGASLDDFRLCLHHPDGVMADLSGACDCRKPAPGMLLSAARELDIELEASWMVGDADSDLAAGQAAGCHTVLIEHPASAHRRSGSLAADVSVRNFGAAVPFILETQEVRLIK